MKEKKEYGSIKGPYLQKSVKQRIEALFLDNLGKIITRSQLDDVAKDPETGEAKENWHQRLSELRTDSGYTILSGRDRIGLRISEYLMPTAERRPGAGRRVKPTKACWDTVLQRSGHRCEWEEDGTTCNLQEGDIDHIGGGSVRLTPDHRTPHSVNPEADCDSAEAWRALCSRHQVMKKNYWDDRTGKLNVIAIIQSASKRDKQAVFQFLKAYFGKEAPGHIKASLLEVVKKAPEDQKRAIFEFLTEYFSQR